MPALRLPSTSLPQRRQRLHRLRHRSKRVIALRSRPGIDSPCGGGKNLKKCNWLKRAGLAMVGAFLLIGLSACNRNSSGGDVMASVNGREIYRSEVDKYYSNQTAGSDQQPTGEQAVSLRLSILNELIETEILMQRAEKLGLLATDEEVDRKLKEIKSPYITEEFKKN